MIKFIKVKLACKIMLLLLALPILIGHGTGLESNCSDGRCDPDPADVYILSGGEDSGENVEIGAVVHFTFLAKSYVSKPEDANATVEPLVISPQYVPPEKDFYLSVNGPFAGSSNHPTGELWLHNLESGQLKLLHAGVSPSFIRIEFDTEAYGGLQGPQKANISSSSMYTLAGDESGGAHIEVEGGLEIFLNGSSIFKKDTDSGDNILSPIVFDAQKEDIIRVVVQNPNAGEQSQVSSFWLFSPAGEGVKLFHGGESASIPSGRVVFIDMSYSLP